MELENVLVDFIAFATGGNQSGMEEKFAANVSCKPGNRPPRKLFTPVGSFGVTAFVTYFLPIVVIFGIIGNVITYIIIKESAERLIGNFYIKMLTILDTISVICLLPSLWAVMIVRPYHHYLDKYSYTWVDYIASKYGWCQARLVITFFTRTLSIYTIILFSIERCIQVTRPFLSQRLCTVANAKKSMVFLTLLSVGICMPYIWSFDKLTFGKCGHTKTICKANDLFFRMRIFQMFILSVVPTIIILICNVIIIIKMRKSIRSIYRQPAAGDDGKDDSDEEKKRNKELTIRLLAISFAFFFLNLPLFVVTSGHSYYELTDEKYHRSGPWADAFTISLLLFVINLGINFLLYCFTGRAFRKAAISLVLCRMEKMRHYRSSMTPGGSRATRSSNVPRSESGRKLLKQRPSIQQESQM